MPTKDKEKEDLEKRVKELEKKMESFEKVGTVKTKKKREGPPKPPSEYNKFFKEKHTGIKKEHPDWTAKQIFTEVARLWKEKKAQQKGNDSD